MRAWVGRRSCAHLAWSLLLITNKMYGPTCGSRASEPSSRSHIGLYDTSTGGGSWREQARRSLRLVVESCAQQLPAGAQWLLPARLLICAACLLPPSCTHWPRAAQQCRHQSQHLQLNAAAGASGKFFCYARTDANATKSVRWVSRARIFWEDGPPRPSR